MRGGTKQKGTLLYDGSASPSSATSSEPAQNRGDGQNAGTIPQSATDKANVPFDDDIISQELQTGKIKTPSQSERRNPNPGLTAKGPFFKGNLPRTMLLKTTLFIRPYTTAALLFLPSAAHVLGKYAG